MKDSLTSATAQLIVSLEILKLVGNWGIFSIAYNNLPDSLPLPIYLMPHSKRMLSYILLLVMFEFIISEV
jgi:hypothetical protein